MARDWYSPGEVHFSIRTARWLIQNLGSLRDGHYPPEASNYIDIPGGIGRHRAPFITAADYYIEITDRLEKCGIDGLILLAMECWGETQAALAKYLKMPEWSITRRGKTALGYVASGPARRWHNTKKRKAVSYDEFRNKPREKRNKNPI